MRVQEFLEHAQRNWQAPIHEEARLDLIMHAAAILPLSELVAVCYRLGIQPAVYRGRRRGSEVGGVLGTAVSGTLTRLRLFLKEEMRRGSEPSWFPRPPEPAVPPAVAAPATVVFDVGPPARRAYANPVQVACG